MNQLQKKKNEFPKSESSISSLPKSAADSPKSEIPKLDVSPAPNQPTPSPSVDASIRLTPTEISKSVAATTAAAAVGDVKIADLHVPITSIKPGKYFLTRNSTFRKSTF